VTQARDELAELINRVAYGHERIILTRHSKPVACIVPPEDLAWLEQRGQERINLTSTGSVVDLPHLPPAADPLPIAAQLTPVASGPARIRKADGDHRLARGNVPLGPVKTVLSRSLTDSQPCCSDRIKARTGVHANLAGEACGRVHVRICRG
jgi:prevent-host-death family protein